MGVLLALLSALFFGLNNATARRGVVTSTAQQAILVTVPVNAAMFLVAALLVHQITAWRQLSPLAIAMLAAAGVINYVIARYCNYRSIKVIGAVRAGPIMQLGMIVSIAAGVILLEETLSIGRLGGVSLILLGTFLVISRRGAASVSGEPVRRTEGYVFALLGSIGYGVAPVLIRVGCGGTTLGMIGGLISFAGAQLVLLCILACMPSQRQALRDLDRASVKWLALTGLINGCAQITLFMALTMAPVSLVVPIQRTSVAFRVIFSFLINRELESFERSTLVGSAVSMMGALVLSAN